MAIRKKQKSQWASVRDEKHPSGNIAKLRFELSQSAGGVLGPARAALTAKQQSMPVRLIALGEVLADATSSPVGRFVTATIALMGAWLLI